MAAKNPDSLTNAQGEFHPRQPGSEPLEKSGHQIGQKVSPADHAPEFSAKTLPPGTAPKESTYQPNPINEIPGQANNPDVLRSHGKEEVRTDPLSTLPGATSADVHTGLGHPGQGQTSNELRHDGQHGRKRDTPGYEGAGATGGSGIYPGDKSVESRRLETDDHPKGPKPAYEHNATLEGAESKVPASADEVAAEGDKVKKHDGDHHTKGSTGVPDRGAGSDRQY